MAPPLLPTAAAPCPSAAVGTITSTAAGGTCVAISAADISMDDPMSLCTAYSGGRLCNPRQQQRLQSSTSGMIAASPCAAELAAAAAATGYSAHKTSDTDMLPAVASAVAAAGSPDAGGSGAGGGGALTGTAATGGLPAAITTKDIGDCPEVLGAEGPSGGALCCDAAAAAAEPPGQLTRSTRVVGGDGGGGGVHVVGRIPRNALTLETLRGMFELPAQDVVRALGISATDLKRRCRALGIRRWPHRKLASLQRLVQAVNEDVDLPANEREVVLETVAATRSRIFEDPNVDLDSSLKVLRQVQYKRHFLERRGYGGSAPFETAAAQMQVESREVAGAAAAADVAAATRRGGRAGGRNRTREVDGCAAGGGPLAAEAEGNLPFRSGNGDEETDAAFLAVLKARATTATSSTTAIAAAAAAGGARRGGAGGGHQNKNKEKTPPGAGALLRVLHYTLQKTEAREDLPTSGSDRLTLAAADKYGKVSLWDVDVEAGGPAEKTAGVLMFQPHSEYVSGLRWLGREAAVGPCRLITTSYDGSVRALDLGGSGMWVELPALRDPRIRGFSALDVPSDGRTAYLGDPQGNRGSARISWICARERSLNVAVAAAAVIVVVVVVLARRGRRMRWRRLWGL
ncbi:RWP-RK domain-containing transcription factor [Volvox carteri f. nagariensis]|uniref:RWP-RK domain-containing transcription factor n=1 Tax=Volvox carteri f. nagariensis TaxID=3068 RepID=D8TZQ1_VOLCA|nr:RWP-RK domain-containing transcription factor [Volvox carteri f. nagariensis]EFJ47054.1 RWP-RK domain-containing transcription factor [Volvox carteri f. nagariensis]|eukprot:XP_002951949.1 RWP-RK domain-containing transcription factor [Volvox carteri f. nagariensis]